MKNRAYYDALPWEVRVERDIRADGSIYYVARHPEFGPTSGPLGTGATPEEALADLREARQGLIGLMLERGDPVSEPAPVRVDARA